MSETEHAATFQAPDLEEVALLFPTYDIHALIACGGMGAVYQATQRSLERIAAIKILPREFSTDAEFRKGFEAEAKAMAKLNHPNLIGVYDFGEVDGMLYIVMEYVDGKSLFHSAHGRAVDQADALRIVSQVCAGLDHAHSNGVLHRDIKPANILLDSSVSPKVGDFGLARALESQIQEGEQIFGTPGYTAPEVLDPPYSFDQRADVFSVGVMLHELLTGKLPDADPRPASQLCKCNPRLDAVIRKATNPDPALRFFSAGALGAELDRIAGSPAGALLTNASSSAPSRKIYAPPKYQAKPSSSGAGIIIFIVAVAAIAAAIFFLNKEAPVPGETGNPGDAAPKTVHIDLNPRPTPLPAAEPVPVAETPAGKFDVPAFLKQSRGSIAGRVRPFSEKAISEIRSNTRGFERGLGALIENSAGGMRASAGETLDQSVRVWDADGHRIPATLPPGLAGIDGAGELHKEFLGKQTAIQETAADGIRAESGIYIIGLENQIEQSRRTGDQDAINGIQVEIDRVKSDAGYFHSLFEK